MNWVSTRFILEWGTVYCTVHWWLRVHNALDPQSLYIKWLRNCIGTQKSRNFRKHIRKTKLERHWILRVKRCTRKSPNQIQLNLTLLFILQDWLWTSKAAKVSCTGFCFKTTELHAPTICTEFDPGWFSRKENFTLRFTDKFGTVTEVFRALGKIDPESLYLTWPKKCIWTQKSHIFRNTTERQIQNDTECTKQKDALQQIQIKFSWKFWVLSILNDSQSRAAQVSCTGFSSKAHELQSAIV